MELDTRENYNPGWKYNYWEQKGVPLRIELGPKDLEKEQVVFARRDDASPSGKMTVKWSEVAARAPEMLETIQAALLDFLPASTQSLRWPKMCSICARTSGNVTASNSACSGASVRSSGERSLSTMS